MPNHRPQHIAKLLQEELNLLVGAELSDPRLDDAMVNVTHVVMSPDLRSARVYVEHALPPESTRQVLAALAHAEGFLREALVENVNLRYVPHLSFHVDNIEQRGRRIDEILDTIELTDPKGDHAKPKSE
jgi:ribosome-binding factor A